ncbi:MAG: sulfite exporter TauE/SafE family protein [Phycisphaerales bacterium]
MTESLLDTHPVAFDLVTLAGAAVAGCFGALVGLGGGLLVVPLLVLGLGVEMHLAMGASLVAVIATSTGAAAARGRDELSNYRVGMFLELAATVGAVGGALLAAMANPAWLMLLFGGILYLTAGLSWRQKGDVDTSGMPEDPWSRSLRLDGRVRTRDGERDYRVQRPGGGFLVMLGAGVVSGLLGIGSGVLKVLAMDTLMKMPFKVSTTTSNFMIGLTAAASVGVYVSNGNVDPMITAPVLLGIVPGAMLGARLVPVLRTEWLRRMFLVALVLVATNMVVRGGRAVLP